MLFFMFSAWKVLGKTYSLIESFTASVTFVGLVIRMNITVLL